MEPWPPWVKLAYHDLGISEILGDGNNPKIEAYHKYTTIKNTDDAVPWCSSALCAWFERSGIPSTKSAAAISWEGWGVPTDPRFGCVAILRRGGKNWQRHGTLWIAANEHQFVGLGGNQFSQLRRVSDVVNFDLYDKKQVTAYRWPDKFKYQQGG